MRFVYLAIFIISTAIHLFASLKQNKGLRNVTKPIILLALLGFYCSSVEVVSWLVVAAILTSWIGDLLLIGPGTKWFASGGISFMISHIFFILAYAENVAFSNVPILLIIGIGLVYAGTVVILFSKLKKHLPKALFYPMFFYLLINGTMNAFAWFRLISTPCLGSIVTAVGALLFFVSDSSLFFVRFDKNSKLKTHFLVMLTYSLGEFLILLGLILL